MALSRHLTVAAAVLAALIPSASYAAVTINVGQTGGDVTVSLSGSLDTTGLTVLGTALGLADALRGTTGFVGVGANNVLMTGYTGLTGPLNFGPGTSVISATSSTGDPFVLNAQGPTGVAAVSLVKGYGPGSALSSSATYLGQTLASLGLTSGTYTFTAPHDTITVNIGTSGSTPAVPEPGTWMMMILGFGGLGFAMRRKGSLAGAQLTAKK